MFFTRYILFLLFILICKLINNTNENELFFFKNNDQKRIKRFLLSQSSTSKSIYQKQDENDQQYYSFNQNKQTKKEPKIGYTQQDLVEINRILLEREHDYYGILKIKKSATPTDINNAYRKLSLRVHPDKIRVATAKEATQRLNRARDQLLKQFEQTYGNTRPQTTVPFTTRLITFKRNQNYETATVINQFNSFESSFFTSTSIEKAKVHSIHNHYTFLLFAFIILIITITIFIIYCKKRQRYSSSVKNYSDKRDNYVKYDTPRSDDADEISNIQDEE